MNTINLYHIPFEEMFLQIKSGFPHYEYDFKKHLINLKDDNFDRTGFVRLPLHLIINDQLQVLDELATVLYLSIESGNAAICIMEGKENDYHTTFSAYMTRKKQGVSQIKYLNKKGKSRAGSRVRLAATTEFFESINNTLSDLFEDYVFDRIAMNCNSTLIPYLFNAKASCPFDKKDERIYKIPVHIPQSNYTNLDAAIKKLMAPTLFYNEEEKDLFESFI